MSRGKPVLPVIRETCSCHWFSAVGAGPKMVNADPKCKFHNKIKSIDDLLSEEEREKLQKDLQQMADLRRRVEAESRNMVLP